MKHREWSLLLYLAIWAIVIAGLYTFGVPTSTLVYATLALACPTLMIFIPDGTVAATKKIATPQPQPAPHRRQVATSVRRSS